MGGVPFHLVLLLGLRLSLVNVFFVLLLFHCYSRLRLALHSCFTLIIKIPCVGRDGALFFTLYNFHFGWMFPVSQLQAYDLLEFFFANPHTPFFGHAVAPVAVLRSTLCNESADRERGSKLDFIGRL